MESIKDIEIKKELEIKEKRIAKLKKENAVLNKRLERAKECMNKLLFIIKSDPANVNINNSNTVQNKNDTRVSIVNNSLI